MHRRVTGPILTENSHVFTGMFPPMRAARWCQLTPSQRQLTQSISVEILPPSLPPSLPFCTVSRSVSPPLSSSLSGLPSKFLRPPSFPFCTLSRSVRPPHSSCLGPPFLPQPPPAFQSPNKIFFGNPRTRHLPPPSFLAHPLTVRASVRISSLHTLAMLAARVTPRRKRGRSLLPT